MLEITIGKMLVYGLDELRKSGYQIDESTLSFIFSMIGNHLCDGKTLEELIAYIKPLIVKNKTEADNFEKDFKQAFKHNRLMKVFALEKEREQAAQRTNEYLGKSQQNLEDFHKKLQELNQNQKKFADMINEKRQKIISDFLTKHKDAQVSLRTLAKSKAKRSGLDQLLQNAILNKKELNDLLNYCEHMLENAASSKDAMQAMKLVKDYHDMLKKLLKLFDNDIEPEIEATQRKIESIKKDQENFKIQQQKNIQQINAKIRQLNQVETKNISSVHRQEFVQQNNKAVQTSLMLADPILEKKFKSLNDKERAKIFAYIRENAQKFRTRTVRSVRTKQRKRLDINTTLKKACATNGTPIRLEYEKPVRQKAKMVLFLDVSGSCSAASSMLITFAYFLKEVFPGGCEIYAFTNTLYDISGLLENTNINDAIQEVLYTIPRSGAYSDYCRPMKEFVQEHMSKLTKDSLVFFLGDARNNKNASGEEYMRAIARRCKKVYWMNTDPYEKWDQGDSIISTYMPYISMVDQILNVKDILMFLERI